jgi:hypothetical protein
LFILYNTQINKKACFRTGGDFNETTSLLGLGRRDLHGHGDDYGLQTQIKQKGKISMMKHYVRLACFVGGTLFGSVGVKLLTSKDAKKAYTHITAAGLRMKDSVMETVTCVQENAADILASAKDINETRAAKEAETQVEDQEA